MHPHLFAEIDGFLEEHKAKMAARREFVAAMATAEYHVELWAAIRPFIQSADDYTSAATFMADMLRRRPQH